jgi:tRNA G46 methylase TrmB
MGKAARIKRERSDSEVDQRVKSRRREIEVLLRSTGFDRTDPQPATWDRLRELFPADHVTELGHAITAHVEDIDNVPAPYSLMWRNPEWARETYGWFAPITIAWLAWLTTLELSPKRIIDLGCGVGVHTCFLATRFPGAEVIGTDVSREGLDVATDLAARLALSNVRFIEADLKAVSPEDLGGGADIVLASTLLADAHPESFGFLDPPDPWSTSASVDTLVRCGSVVGIKTIAELLNIGGTYIGLERAPGALAYANWLGGLAQAGLCPSASGSTDLKFRMSGQAERLQVVLAARDDNAHLDPEELVALVRKQFPADFTTEDELTTDPPRERLWGVEVQVLDSSGSGRTRVEYLRLSSGRTVRFQSTTRGYRQLRTVTDLAAELEYERTVVGSLSETDPSVVAVLEL